MTVVGRTITASGFTDDGFDEGYWTLWFADGTSAVQCWDEWDVRDADETREAAREAQGRRERERVRRLSVAGFIAERARLKRTLTAEEWEAWRDKHEPNWRDHDRWASDLYREVSRQMFPPFSSPTSVVSPPEPHPAFKPNMVFLPVASYGGVQ